MTDDQKRAVAFSLSLVILVLMGAWIDSVLAEGGQTPTAGAQTATHHGGVAKALREHSVEAAFHSDGLGLFLYDRQGKPLSIEKVKATLHVEFLDKARAPIDTELILVPHGAAGADREQDQLFARVSFARVAEAEATATIHLIGLRGEESDVALVLPFRMARIVTYTCETCGLSALAAGSCPKCGRTLLEVRSYYGCRKHPMVALDHEGRCWQCGEASLDLIVEPATQPREAAPDRPSQPPVEPVPPYDKRP